MKIERDVLIDAPLERVWALVTEPGWWIGEDRPTGVELREGDVHVVSTKEHGSYPTRVERVEPPRYVAYRWASSWPDTTPDERNSTLIEFTLAEESDGVRLTVVESGFESVEAPEDVRRKTFDDNSGGWTEELAKFKEYAER